MCERGEIVCWSVIGEVSGKTRPCISASAGAARRHTYTRGRARVLNPSDRVSDLDVVWKLASRQDAKETSLCPRAGVYGRVLSQDLYARQVKLASQERVIERRASRHHGIRHAAILNLWMRSIIVSISAVDRWGLVELKPQLKYLFSLFDIVGPRL